MGLIHKCPFWLISNKCRAGPGVSIGKRGASQCRAHPDTAPQKAMPLTTANRWRGEAYGNSNAGWQSDALRVTDPRSGCTCRRLGVVRGCAPQCPVHSEVVGDIGLVHRGGLDDLSSRPKAATCLRTPKWGRKKVILRNAPVLGTGTQVIGQVFG